MGTLKDILLKKNTDVKVSESQKIEESLINEAKADAPRTDSPTFFKLTKKDYEEILTMVNANINPEGKTREEIIVAKYGTIVYPKTGEQFSIPGLEFDNENYVYEYSKLMRTLVKNPRKFIKIMNWE